MRTWTISSQTTSARKKRSVSHEKQSQTPEPPTWCNLHAPGFAWQTWRALRSFLSFCQGTCTSGCHQRVRVTLDTPPAPLLIWKSSVCCPPQARLSTTLGCRLSVFLAEVYGQKCPIHCGHSCPWIANPKYTLKHGECYLQLEWCEPLKIPISHLIILVGW